MKKTKKLTLLLALIMIFSSVTSIFAGAIEIEDMQEGTVFFKEDFSAAGLDDTIKGIAKNDYPGSAHKIIGYESGAAMYVSPSKNNDGTVYIENRKLVLDDTTTPTTDGNGSFVTCVMGAASYNTFVIEMDVTLYQSDIIAALEKPYFYLLRSRIATDSGTKWAEYLSVNATNGKIMSNGKETSGIIEWGNQHIISAVFKEASGGRSLDIYLDGNKIAENLTAAQGAYFNDSMQWRFGFGNAGGKVAFDSISAYSLEGTKVPAGFEAVTAISETFETNQTLESGLSLVAGESGYVTENGNTYFRFVNTAGKEGRIQLASSASDGFEASMDIKFEKDAETGEILYPQSVNAGGAMWVFGFKSTVNSKGNFASFVAVNNVGEILTANGAYNTGIKVGADEFTNIKMRWTEADKSYTVWVNNIPVAKGTFSTIFSTASFDLRLMNVLTNTDKSAIQSVAVNIDNIIFKSLTGNSVDIKTVGAQISTDTVKDEENNERQSVRFVAGINSLNYKQVGFVVTETNNNAYWNIDGTTVYESILAGTETGSVEKVNASDFGCMYLFALTITDVPVEDLVFTVTPYGISDDGTTDYYGASMVVTLNADRTYTVAYK